MLMPHSGPSPNPHFQGREHVPGRPGRFSLCGVLPTHLILSLILLLPGLATAAVSPAAVAPKPDLEACVGAWLTVREWIDELAVADLPSSAGSLPGASGVCILLRHRGRTVGVGSVETAGEPVLDMTDVRSAAIQALANARQDPVVAGLPPAIGREAGRQLTLEMEFSGPLRALLGRTFQAATERLRPGLDGLALRHEDRWWYQYPARLRLMNAVAGPDRQYALALASDLRPQQLEALREQGAVSLYAFETVNLAQAAPNAAPIVLQAGHDLVIDADLTPRMLRTARDQLARHLLNRVLSREEETRILGTFSPSTDRSSNRPPSEQDRYFVSLALATYANGAAPDEDLALSSTVTAQRLLTRPATDADAPSSEMTPRTAATWMLAAAELGVDPPERNLRRATVRDFLEDLRDRPDVEVRSVSQDVVLSAAALARQAEDVNDVILATETSRRVRDLLPLSQQVGLLPWLGWIERSCRDDARLPAELRQSDQDRLRLIHDRALELQVPTHGLTPDLDSGGFQLQPGTRGVTAQSLRPGLSLTSMVSDPAFDHPARRETYRTAQRALIRYLMQLRCREDLAGTWRQPEATRGAIRASTWDARLHPTAQALGLMILTEAAAIPDS